tara:strand:+ start:81 stop:332 length:252 start_codon:yes stop_codon:yes gene_type:complete
MKKSRTKIINLLQKAGYELLTDAKEFVYVGISSTNWIAINLPNNECDTYYAFTGMEGKTVIGESVCPNFILLKIDMYAKTLIK